MVLLHVKKGDESLFLYETTTQVQVADLVKGLVQIQNLRLRLGRLVSATEDLVLYGLYKPENMHGYTEEQLDELIKGSQGQDGTTITKNGTEFVLRTDPTGRRCGEAPNEIVAQTIRKTLENAKILIGKEVVTANRTITVAQLEEALNEIRGAVTIAYPMGLAEYEPVRDILQDTEDLTGTAASKEVFDAENASLWWASKELQVSKKLFEYVGKNEKSKIIVKMQRKGQGPPVREAPLTEEAQKNLMAYYYKKQELDKVHSIYGSSAAIGSER